MSEVTAADPSERRTIPWLEPEEYTKERESFIEANQTQYTDFFQSSPYFSDLSPEMKKKGADLITRFLFGAHMTYRRMGFKHQLYSLLFDIGDGKGYDYIGYNSDKRHFTLKLDWFKRIIRDVSPTAHITVQGGGINEPLSQEDFFEIAGVEEAAHVMYFNEKKQREITTEVPTPNVQYFSSDLESRAMLWKTAYIKRYFPQYYDSIKKTSKQVNEFRRGKTSSDT